MRGDDALSADERSTSSKKVSWETLEKLCQVRLFAAEDAPLLSGTTRQEVYQEKETKFLQVVKPVAEGDVPPGFVSFSNRPTEAGGSANVSMDTQVRWCCPEKYLYKSGWQVSVGDGSVEVLAERKRELRALEAIYSLSDALPPSPEEPQKTIAEIEDHMPPDVPLFCVEDDNELEEGFSPGVLANEPSNNGVKLEVDTLPNQSLRMGSEKNESRSRPGGNSASTWQAVQLDQQTISSCLADADPNVAAAAAAAYAVVKAKERGTLVDQDLLIKILTNPILIKILLAANQDLPNQSRDFLRAISKEAQKGCNSNEFAAGRGTSSVGPNMFPLPMQLGCKATASTIESMQSVNETSMNLPWNTFGHQEGARSFLGPSQFYGRTEVSGQAKGAFVSPIYSLPNRQDVLKDLIQQHGTEKGRNEGPLRGFPDTELVGNSKLVPTAEMLRAPVIGAFSQLGGGNQAASSSHGRNDGFPQSRFGGEMSHSRFQKPCLYFNTPKGCRRGTSCFYLHDTAPEQPFMEQARTDFFQFQQSKRPKFGVPDKE